MTPPTTAGKFLWLHPEERFTVIFNISLLALRTTAAVSSDRDFQATLQFCLLGLALSLVFLNVEGPSGLVQAAITQ
jgi:hypothetical protein